MIYAHEFHGIPLQTGDIICTQDGEEDSPFGQIWRLLGRLVPGEVDHCVVYVGPGGRCVESAARGVLVFEMPGNTWEAGALSQKRLLLDTFYGVAYPLAGRDLRPEEEKRLRVAVANYCLDKALLSKPYNLNVFDAQRDSAFYCSQLVYKAYLRQGLDLNSNTGVPVGGLLERIVFPQEIWNACPHRRYQPEQAG